VSQNGLRCVRADAVLDREEDAAAAAGAIRTGRLVADETLADHQQSAVRVMRCGVGLLMPRRLFGRQLQSDLGHLRQLVDIEACRGERSIKSVRRGACLAGLV
jgi:hypothetical protein